MSLRRRGEAFDGCQLERAISATFASTVRTRSWFGAARPQPGATAAGLDMLHAGRARATAAEAQPAEAQPAESLPAEQLEQKVPPQRSPLPQPRSGLPQLSQAPELRIYL